MGNISKIIALTALITLAFGITAINIAMAENPAKELLIVKIYDNRTVTVEFAPGVRVEGVQRGNDSTFLEGKTIVKTLNATIGWTNPCGWINIMDRWYYVCP